MAKQPGGRLPPYSETREDMRAAAKAWIRGLWVALAIIMLIAATRLL